MKILNSNPIEDDYKTFISDTLGKASQRFDYSSAIKYIYL